jgi:CheY-like chemotaxis protein
MHPSMSLQACSGAPLGGSAFNRSYLFAKGGPIGSTDPGLDGRPGRQTAPLALDLPSGHGEGILVVDDDPDICFSTKFLLERLGYRVLTALNGAEAVGLYVQNAGQVQLVLTDLQMPVMDGRAAIQALHALNPDLPILVLSANTPPSGTGRGLDGACAVLAKPLLPEQLLPLIAEILRENCA